jgi:hypothetical protein
MDKEKTKFLIISNIYPDQESKDFLAAVEAVIKVGDFDAVIDLGGSHFDQIAKDEQKQALDEYFTLFEGISDYVPYAIVSDYFNYADDILGWSTNKLSFIHTKSSQILMVDTQKSASQGKVTTEELFSKYDSSQGRMRIILTSSPFYCSNELVVCSKVGKNNIDNYENAFIENDVDLVISGSGYEYERSFPVSEGKSQNIENKSKFSEVASKPVYITINGAYGRDGTSTMSKEFSAKLSSKQSYGILEIKTNSTVIYTQYTKNHDSIDHFQMEIVEKDYGDSTMFRYLIYGILIA